MNPARRIASLLVAALVALSAPGVGLAARGTDVSFGYRWVDSADGAEAGPAAFDGLPTTIAPADNSPPTPVTLPWPFPFHGVTYTQAFISDNGWISFADPGDSLPTPQALPSATAPPLLIAPLWTDLDCSDAAAGRRIIHGPVNSVNAYRFVYAGLDVATAQPVAFELHLYRDGRIKFHHVSGASFASATVGMQDATQLDGFSIVDRGVPAADVPSPPPADYLVDIDPPALLPAECALVPAIACGTTASSLPGAFPDNIGRYGCGSGQYWARENLHAITLSSATRLRVTLTPGSGRNLAMHLLEDCSERLCIAGPGSVLDVPLAPGTYTLAVDAPAESDEGDYTLQVDCAPLGTPLACGDTVAGDTTGGSSLFFNPPCGGTLAYTATERIHSIDATGGPSTIRGILGAADPALDILLYRVPPTGRITDADCIQRGDTMVLLGDVPAGEYLLVVDGVNGAIGPYSLETSCAVLADCSTLAGSVDFTSGNRQFVSGDTTLGASNVSRYNCELDAVFDGPEVAFELILPRAGQVAIHELGAPSGLRWFVLDSCNEGTCRGESLGSCGFTLGAGPHVLVIDGASGAGGPFEAELVLDDTFGHWSACEDPMIPTLPTDTVRTDWSFDDGAFCISDPASHNFPDGCTFAMYVAIRCGTEFHIPLFDVESGHVRIFDIFRDEYVSLTAVSSAGWFASGTDIAWEDCTGVAPDWNMETTDISFSNPDGLCGVYRLEFPNHSGFEWQLFANCEGSNTGLYPIFDSLCGALDAHEPLPELHLVSASAALACPDISVTYTIANSGCADAVDVPVAIVDAGVAIATDIVPSLPAGTSTTRSFGTTFPGGVSSASVWVQVDPDGLIEECGEVAGAGCVVSPGLDAVLVGNCAPLPCFVIANGRATPPRLCEGERTTIDASASVSMACPGGQLEYQLSGPGGTVAWQADPVFPDLAPGADADYLLEVRCADPGERDTCVDTATVSVAVERRPVLDPASVAATESDCAAGITLSWSPATFLGPTGTGIHNIYRSTISCADAVARAPIASVTLPPYIDASTIAGETYYYVLEAEDLTPFSNGCVPDGPVHGGATTRVDVAAGTCIGILERDGSDPALLPRVGPTLRVGWPDATSPSLASLRWGTDLPLDIPAGQHYHVLRSTSPAGGFTQLNAPDPPLLQAPSLADAAADQPDTGTQVLHYLVVVSNACHADNRLEDPSAP